MKRTAFISAMFGSALIMGAAHAATDYSSWDTNGDGKISFAEWEAHSDKMDTYSTWDTNKDGQLSREEYNRGNWAAFDANKDDNLDEKEFGVFMSETEYKFPGNTGSNRGK